MTIDALQKKVEEAVPKLLEMAKGLSWNQISDNCKFILTEIKDSPEHSKVQRMLRKKENDAKVPVTFSEIMLQLQSIYNDLHDINLHIYRAGKQMTIIDIRYYPKSSLDPGYRQNVLHHPPMLHCRVAQPPWLTNRKTKFNINWEHRQWLIEWHLFLMRVKSKHRRLLQ